MRWVRWAKETPSAVLLVVQLVGVLIYPYLGRTTGGRAAFAAFGILVLSLVVLAVRPTPSLTWMSGFVAVPALVLLVWQIFSGASWLFTWSSAFEAALYFYAAIGLIRYMFADHVVTRDEQFAVGATFTLVAWAFAYLFVVVQAVYPGSFTAAIDPAGERTWMELLFLSFSTLSSTGLSDVVPILGLARSVQMLEQLAGVLFIAMVVARMVGLTILRLRPSQPSTGRIETDDSD